MGMTMFLSASDTPISEAAVKALVGFVIVLAVLLLLVGIFYLTGFLFRTKWLSKDNLFERKKKNVKSNDVTTVDTNGEETDEELYAVISAVISAMYDDEAIGDDVKPDFVIRRVKRK
ncbi:MAG: OadG family protein [Clostridiales bacterium]|nr:OadG family protein [Clostridiales bacterium]